MRTLQKCGAGIISYVICGVISGRPGMTVNAIAYKSDLVRSADPTNAGSDLINSTHA